MMPKSRSILLNFWQFDLKNLQKFIGIDLRFKVSVLGHGFEGGPAVLVGRIGRTGVLINHLGDLSSAYLESIVSSSSLSFLQTFLQTFCARLDIPDRLREFGTKLSTTLSLTLMWSKCGEAYSNFLTRVSERCSKETCKLVRFEF